ncbi:unnamed protein product [Closterium sp. NIES-54]
MCCAAMASLRVLAFDHEGRLLLFDTWLDDLQLYLLSDSRDNVSLFDHTYGAAPTPPAIADSATRSQWLTRDAAARLAIRNHLPLAECARFGQHKTTQTLYDAVVTRYSLPATAALGRLLLPYLFPELSAFATVKDLVSHLCASDARYRAATPAEDHFLSLDTTSLTVDELEQHLLVEETSAVAVGVARGTLRTPFLEGCSPSPVAPSYASAASVDVLSTEDVGAASASAKRRRSKGKGGRGGGGGSRGGGGGSSGGSGGSGGGGGGGSGGGSGGVGGGGGGNGGSDSSGSGGSGGSRTGAQHGGTGGGQKQREQRRSDSPSPQQLQLLRSGVAIFDLDYDAILFAMYGLSASTEGDCYRCVPPDPGIEAAALGAGESSLPGTARAEALHARLRLADPSEGPVVSRFSTVLPCPAVPSGSLSSLHLPSFSTNLVSTAALQDVMVTTTTPGSQRVSICTCTRTGRHLVTFTRRPGSSLYTLATEPPQVAPQFPLTSIPLPVCSSVRVRPGSRLLLVSPPDAPDSSVAPPPASPLPATPSWHALPPPCLWSSQVSASPPALACPTPSSLRRGAAARRSSLLLVSLDECSPADSPHGSVGPSPREWIGLRALLSAVRLQLREQFHQDLPVLRLHFPRVSLPETSPTLRWTGEVGDASMFRVWGSCAFVRDTSADKLSARAIPCDVTFDESVPFYCLFPDRSAPPLPLPLFLAPGPPPVAVSSGAARGAACGGAASGGAEPGGAESEGAGSWGVELGGEEPGGAEPRGAASSRGPTGASPGHSPQQLYEWLVRRAHLWRGATGAGGAGDARAGGIGVSAGASGIGGAAAAGPRGARTRGTGAAGTGDVGGTGAGDPTEPGAAGAGGCGAGGAGARGAGSGGSGAGGAGAGVGGAGAGGTGAGGAGAVDPGGLLQSPLLSPSPLLATSPYTEQSGGLPEHLESASRPVSPVCTARRIPRSRLPPVPGKHAMAVRPSSVPLRVPLLAPPESSLLEVRDPESNHARAPSPTVSRPLATAVTNPSFESAAASALVAELLDFAAACRLDYATALVAESGSASPPSVGGECALGTDVLQDRQEDFECFAAAVPCFASMLLAPEGDPDAPDIPTPRSYAKAITGPYSSQWQAAMDAKMASWKSTGTYVNEVPPRGANIVDGMWIFMVKRPPGSPPACKARYVAQGFSQQQGVDYFQIFSPTPKMTTLRVLLHVAAQRDYELHSLHFSTAFLQGSLHEEI